MTSWKKYHSKKNRIWWTSILFVSIISYGYGLITVRYHIFPYRQFRHFKNFIIAGKKEQQKFKNASTIAGKKEQRKSYYSNKKSFFEVNGSKADIVMIGDSITDSAEWNELFPNISIVNRGIGGDTTEGVLNRMESIYSTNAKKAFIMIGINDLTKNISVDEISSHYEKIVVQLKQHKITPYVQSVLLVGVKRAYLNENIKKFNLKLKELSRKENIVFIDLNKVFAQNGKLKQSFSSEDDIHLNGEGYAAWKNSIKKFID